MKTYRRTLGDGRPGRDGGATSKDLEGSLLAGEVSGGCSESGQHGDWRCKRQREDRTGQDRTETEKNQRQKVNRGSDAQILIQISAPGK